MLQPPITPPPPLHTALVCVHLYTLLTCYNLLSRPHPPTYTLYTAQVCVDLMNTLVTPTDLPLSCCKTLKPSMMAALSTLARSSPRTTSDASAVYVMAMWLLSYGMGVSRAYNTHSLLSCLRNIISLAKTFSFSLQIQKNILVFVLSAVDWSII